MEAPWADVPEDMRPRNVSGQCAWDAGESVFGGAGYTEFKGWGRNASRIGWVGGWVTGVTHAAQAYGIETKVVTNKDYSIFEYAEKAGVPVYIQIAVYCPNDHAVCLTGLDADYAYILDNNGPPVVKKWPRRTFDRVWNGIACCPCHRKNPKPVVPAPVKPSQPKPTEPVKPADQPKPVSGCNCPPAQDLKPITDGLNRLVDSVAVVNKSVGDLTTKVGSIDQRLVTVEGKLANPPQVIQLPPPSTVTPDPAIKQMQDKLDKLEANMKQSGTLHITVTPK